MSAKAVLISDVHFNLKTMDIAAEALVCAINKANELEVPLIVCGDLHDTKANLRGECVKKMIEVFKQCKKLPFVLVGNHDKINEKSEDHSLEFLQSYARIVDRPRVHDALVLIPYQHDLAYLKSFLAKLNGKTLIMHQGVTGSNSGEYIQDHTALTKEDLAGFRVISGHYHQRQTFDLPNDGTFTYLGNPYTLNFGEAFDGPKGYHILQNDGKLDFIQINVRKHIIVEFSMLNNSFEAIAPKISEKDLVWVKGTGTSSELALVTKLQVANVFSIKNDFKFDKIPTDKKESKIDISNVTPAGIIDMMLELRAENAITKSRLKQLWRSISAS